MGLVSRRKKKKKIDEVGRFAKKKNTVGDFFRLCLGSFFLHAMREHISWTRLILVERIKGYGMGVFSSLWLTGSDFWRFRNNRPNLN